VGLLALVPVYVLLYRIWRLGLHASTRPDTARRSDRVHTIRRTH
jgi:hypothetical protein